MNVLSSNANYLLTLTKVPVRLVPSPLLSASSSIKSAIDFLTAFTSVKGSALASATAGERDRASKVPVAAAGAAYRLPSRAAAFIMMFGYCRLLVVGKMVGQFVGKMFFLCLCS